MGGLASLSAYGATPGSVCRPSVPAPPQPHGLTAGDSVWHGQVQVVLPAELFLCPVRGYQPVLKELPRSTAVWCSETQNAVNHLPNGWSRLQHPSPSVHAGPLEQRQSLKPPDSPDSLIHGLGAALKKGDGQP